MLRGNRLRQGKLPVHQRLGPIQQDSFQREDIDGEDEYGNRQWCPSGILTKYKKRRVQRMKNREHFQEVQEEINHRLRKTRQE